MKADLITLHTVYNYGSVLQAYATEKIFKDHGVDITIINYIRPNNTFFKSIKGSANNSLIKSIVVFPSLIIQKYKFGKFNKKMLNISKNKYINIEDFHNYSSDANFFITGSDQVWNSTWNEGILTPLYLGFVKDKPKMAFSASFGKEKIDLDEVNQTKDLINEYDAISVRENSGVEILKKQYNYEKAIQIVDPTLLISKNEWETIMDHSFTKKDYILIYQLNSNKEFDKFAQKIAKENNKELIRICRRLDQIVLNGKSQIIPTVERFISLFNNASLVITDSFHALSFSINLNIPFLCIYPKKFSTRLDSCLKLFELENRRVINYQYDDVFSKQIDWTAVNKKLTIERKKADKFIDDFIDNKVK